MHHTCGLKLLINETTIHYFVFVLLLCCIVVAVKLPNGYQILSCTIMGKEGGGVQLIFNYMCGSPV